MLMALSRIIRPLRTRAGVAESVDAADSKSAAARCGGSSPPPGTKMTKGLRKEALFVFRARGPEAII